MVFLFSRTGVPVFFQRGLKPFSGGIERLLSRSILFSIVYLSNISGPYQLFFSVFGPGG
jgi:hypothetical protein